MIAPFAATSVVGRAVGAGKARVNTVQLRDFTHDKHHTVDDYPYGGGAGMVLKPAPLFDAVAAVRALPPGPPGLGLHSPGVPDTIVVGAAEAGNDPPAQASIEAEGADLPVILLSPQGPVFTQERAAEL